MILKFKNEKFPNIAVTVDLLTTGIDVHKICNLVFLHRVRFRILYEQMLGRATRPCDRIRKDHFNIFDAVGLYEALEPVTNMKAVAPGPTVTFHQLVKELTSEKQLIAETVFEREDFDKGAFKDHGGFHRLNKIFQGNLNTVLD